MTPLKHDHKNKSGLTVLRFLLAFVLVIAIAVVMVIALQLNYQRRNPRPDTSEFKYDIPPQTFIMPDLGTPDTDFLKTPIGIPEISISRWTKTPVPTPNQ